MIILDLTFLQILTWRILENLETNFFVLSLHIGNRGLRAKYRVTREWNFAAGARLVNRFSRAFCKLKRHKI